MNHEEQKSNEAVSTAEGRRASRLSRRDLLSASVFTFGGAAIAGTSILRIAQAVDVAAAATPLSPDKFMLASSRLIQHRLFTRRWLAHGRNLATANTLARC